MKPISARVSFLTLLSICFLRQSASAQEAIDTDIDTDTVIVTAYVDDALQKAVAGPSETLICPSNVPVGLRAVKFSGTVTTTGTTTYQVSIQYGSGDAPGKVANGELEPEEVKTNIGSWSISPGLLTLTVTVTQAQPLEWEASLVAKVAGSVFYIFTTPSRKETCNFEIINPVGAIVGFKFEETNGNQIKEPGEPPLAGWTLYIDSNNNAELDAGEPSGVTDSSGVVVFAGLPLGNYRVREVGQPGYVLTFPAAPPWRDVTLSRHGQVETAEFGNFPLPPAIHGQVVVDANENGMRDEGETGLNGAEIELRVGSPTGLLNRTAVTMSMDMDDDGVIDPVTEQGLYWFEDLLPDNYVVLQSKPPRGFDQTFPEHPEYHALRVGLGDVVDGVDFGDVRLPLGSIHGQVFFDADSDGFKSGDEREPGQDGVVVELILGDSVVATTTTMSMDEDGDGSIDPVTETGFYWFEDLIPDTYTVRQQVPGDHVQTSPPDEEGEDVTVVPGEAVDGPSFGNAPMPGSIHGQVFRDDNANGERDVGEPGIDSVVVHLEGREGFQGGLLLDRTVTMSMDVDGDGEIDPEERGFYWFERVAPGNYGVSIEVPEGLAQTFPRAGEDHEVTVNPNERVEDRDFGVTTATTGSIHGQVWLDLGQRGIRDSDADVGLDGQDVELLNADGEVIATATTMSMDLDGDGMIDPFSESGFYWFEDVEPGTYRVREQVPDQSYTQTFPASGSFADPVPEEHEVTINPGDRVEGQDFGERPSSRGDTWVSSIHGQVFQDANQNGIRDPGEVGRDGVKIRAIGDAGPENRVFTLTETMSMDLNNNGQIEPETEQGLYWIDADAGYYFVEALFEPGQSQTAPPPPGRHRVLVIPPEPTDSVDFGFSIPTSIHGQKFLDANGDGQRSGPDEVGLSGWVIELIRDGVVVDSQVTHGMDVDADGETSSVGEQGLYWFTNLVPGVYTVRERAREGFVQTVPPGGEGYTVELEGGAEIADLDFGNTAKGSIHGQKFFDADGDGRFDVTEPGLDGVLIHLLDEDGTVIDSTRTMSMDLDGNGTIRDVEKGLFWFTGLDPGTYTVREVIEPHQALVQTFPFNEGDYTVTLEAGTVTDLLFFGNASLGGSIHGQKWLDVDGDGRFDADEPGLDGVVIELVTGETTTGSGLLGSTTTMSMDVNGDGEIADSEKGFFWFEHLRPGVYNVREVIQPPLQQTYPFPEGDYRVSVEEGQVIDTLLFGNIDLGGSIHGQKVLDLDGDGEYDNNEPGLDGITIELVDADGAVVAVTETHSMDLDGNDQINRLTERGLFWFEDVVAGDYVVREIVEEPLIQTFPGGEGTYRVTIGGGEVNDAVFFGNAGPGSGIHGQKFHDINGDGRRGADEPGIDGVTIKLFRNAELIAETRTMSMDLDGDGAIQARGEQGHYWFDNLEEGSYLVAEEASEGFTQTFPGELGLEKSHEVTLGAGEQVEDVNFGNTKLGSIHGRVFDDADEEGGGLDGVTVSLQGPTGLVINFTETMSMDTDGDGEVDPDEQGLFWIENLPPGHYSLSLFGNSVQQTSPGPGFTGGQRTLNVQLGPGERLEGLVLGGRVRKRVPVDSPNDASDSVPGDGACDTGSGKGAATCTLRGAIEECNAQPDDAPSCLIDLAGIGKTAATIRPGSPLPVIRRSMVVDGGGTAVLDGALAGDSASGLVLATSNAVLSGLSITGFSRHGVLADSGNGNRITNNRVTGNAGDGVRVRSGLGNSIITNAIFDNGGLGIDLGGDGSTENDGDFGLNFGANLLRDAPGLLVVSANRQRISGRLISKPNSVYTVEFYAGSECDPTGRGEGERYVGSTSVTTGPQGFVQFLATVDSAVAVGQPVTATATDAGGNTSEFSECVAAVETDVTEDRVAELPERVRLLPNYPNPFNPSTNIVYDLPRLLPVHLAVYNVLGQRIATLVDGRQQAGQYTILFDARDLPSGLYLYRLTAGDIVETRAMILSK